MSGKKVSKRLNPSVEIIEAFSFVVLLALVSIYFWSTFNSHKSVEPNQASSTTLLVSTTTTVSPVNKSLTREVFLDIKSGEGLPWFSNKTLDDVRSGMKIWEERTNHSIKFEEVRGESVADIAIKFSNYFNISSPGKKTIGEAFVYLGEIRGTIYLSPSGASCRNQVRAIHEIGHIIGLNHSTAHSSVMYPIESCVQNITDDDARIAVELISQFV